MRETKFVHIYIVLHGRPTSTNRRTIVYHWQLFISVRYSRNERISVKSQSALKLTDKTTKSPCILFEEIHIFLIEYLRISCYYTTAFVQIRESADKIHRFVCNRIGMIIQAVTVKLCIILYIYLTV